MDMLVIVCIIYKGLEFNLSYHYLVVISRFILIYNIGVSPKLIRLNLVEHCWAKE